LTHPVALPECPEPARIDPTLDITILKPIEVPTGIPNKPSGFHFFRVFIPNLQQEAHTPSLRLGNGGEARFDNRKL
jgi:hypothetical protein